MLKKSRYKERGALPKESAPFRFTRFLLQTTAYRKKIKVIKIKVGIKIPMDQPM